MATIYKNRTATRIRFSARDSQSLDLEPAAAEDIVTLERSGDWAQFGAGARVFRQECNIKNCPEPQDGVVFIVPETVALYMRGTGRTDFAYPVKGNSGHGRFYNITQLV